MKKFINTKGVVIACAIVSIYVFVFYTIMQNLDAIYIHMALRRIEMINPSYWTVFLYNSKAVGLNFFTNQYVGWTIIALVSAYIATFIGTYNDK